MCIVLSIGQADPEDLLVFYIKVEVFFTFSVSNWLNADPSTNENVIDFDRIQPCSQWSTSDPFPHFFIPQIELHIDAVGCPVNH